jgi:signal transduction histidine kinase
MLGNIVENALKYSSPGGTCVQVALERRQKQGDDWALLRVQDDGPGIADEHLPHLFERFYRVETSRTHNASHLGELYAPATVVESDSPGDYDEDCFPGSPDTQPGGNGLGLAIVQWIAEAHGGTVEVQSQAGTGTTFEVLLPYS